MLAVFSSDSARAAAAAGDDAAAAAAGLLKWKRRANVGDVREQEAAELNKTLESLSEAFADDASFSLERLVKEPLADGGVNGLAYVRNARRSFTTKAQSKQNCVSCFFSGDLTQKHINEIHIDRHLHDTNDSQTLIATYANALVVHSLQAFSGAAEFSATTLMRDALRQLNGPYAFVLYDKHARRIVAARDLKGDEPLFWTVTRDGRSLLFSLEKLALFHHADHVSEFPRTASSSRGPASWRAPSTGARTSSRSR